MVISQVDADKNWRVNPFTIAPIVFDLDCIVAVVAEDMD